MWEEFTISLLKQALLSARLVCVPRSSSCTHSFSPRGGNISHPVQKAIRSRRPAPAVIKAETLSSLIQDNTSETTEMWLHLDSDVWARCFTISFAGSFRYFKPVSCWILFCENVAGIRRPLEQLPLCVGKVNTFKTPEMHPYFDSDIWGRCLTIIFGGSFPYSKFLTKINSKVRRK